MGPTHSHWLDSRKVDEGPLLNIEPSRSVQEGRACAKEEEQRDVREPTKWGCVNEWWQ